MIAVHRVCGMQGSSSVSWVKGIIFVTTGLADAEQMLSCFLISSSFYTIDCGTPTVIGYAFTGTTATTYQGASSVSCATGYDGTASPTTINCEASGSWTSVSGCTIKGKYGFY